MSEFIYRFRSLDKLLKFNELQNQSIYFAHPSELNDPLEDYKDIFWQGDEILWKNLFKNYLYCLHYCYLEVRLFGDDVTLTTDKIPVFTSRDNLPTQSYKDKIEALLEDFFSQKQVVNLIKGLTKRELIKRNELLLYLDAIHMFCVHLVQLHDDTLPDDQKNKIEMDRLLRGEIFEENYFNLIDTAIKELENNNLSVTSVFDVAIHTTQQTKLLAVLSSMNESKNKNFIITAFPKNYVRQLETLMFWPWYTSCFSSNPTNSSMWGYYTDGHKGVCLKFKTSTQDGKRGLFLKTITGMGFKKGDPKTNKSYGNVFFELHNINYESKVKPIDFFKTIGRLPYPTLISQWYSDVSGSKSPLVQDVLNSQEDWRNKYWELFYANIPIKTKEWSHEEESRLIHTSLISGEIDKEDRVLNYNFNDLDGIIFGLNMTDDEKVKVIKIAHDICMKNNRLDFNFYQATYDDQSGKINIHELGLIKFSINGAI